VFKAIKEFLTGVRIEIQTEYWCVPEPWGSPEYEAYRKRRKTYEEEMIAKGWKKGWPQPCACCNVGFYRRIKAYPWGRV